MAEATAGNNINEVDDAKPDRVYGTSDQVVDPWCEPCLEETRVKVDAVGYCPECNSHLCLFCQEIHKKWPTLQNHRILRGSRMPKSHADKPIKYQNCVTHGGNETDHYCLQHGTTVCSECMKKDHQVCGVLPISVICNDLSTEDVKKFKLGINDIQQSISITNAALEKNVSDIEDTEKCMIKTAKAERDKIISKANDLFDKTTSKISETCRKKTSEITDRIEMLSDEKLHLDEIINTIDKSTIADIDANMFIRIQSIVASTKECKREIEDTINQLHVTELSFALNEGVRRFHEENKELGTVKETLKPVGTMKDIPDIAFPQPESVRSKINRRASGRDISQIRVKKMSSFNIKTADDKETCTVHGMAITSNGTLLLVDGSNKTVKVFSYGSKFITEIRMDDTVYDIALLSKSTAVFSTADKKLHFCDITCLPSFAVQKSIKLKYSAISMTSYGDNLVVATWTKPVSLKLIDITGQEVWSVSKTSDGEELIGNPYAVQITTFNGTNAAVVTDCKKYTLTLLDANNGSVLKIIDVKDKSPHGLTVDDNGNVFVCYMITREIVVWSSDFADSRVLLECQPIQSRPRQVLYNGSIGELYVACYKNDEIVRFQLSVANE